MSHILPKYIVEGHETADEESPLAPDHEFAPFMIFMPESQDYIDRRFDTREEAKAHIRELTKAKAAKVPVTVVCDYPDSAGPLIYTVELDEEQLPDNAFELPDDATEKSIMDQVVEQIEDDMGSNIVRENLTLKFAIKGDLYPTFDWR